MTIKDSANMKNAISALILAGALAAGSARAADLPSRKDAPVYVPPPVFSWTGFYAGLNAGGGWNAESGSTNNLWGASNGEVSGVVGGGQIGYNYQLSPLFVVGLETDFQGTSLSSRNNGWLNTGVSLPWFGTVRGRAGVALLDSQLLVYGTGGFAYGEVKNEWAGLNDVRTGWTAGGGVEWAFLPNWSAKVEYLYTDLNNSDGNSWSALGTTSRHTKFHTVRVGVNYHFNLFSPTPVVARY